MDASLGSSTLPICKSKSAFMVHRNTSTGRSVSLTNALAHLQGWDLAGAVGCRDAATEMEGIAQPKASLCFGEPSWWVSGWIFFIRVINSSTTMPE